MGGRQHPKPVSKKSTVVFVPVGAMDQKPLPWYESTLLWGAIGIFGAIVLTVVAAMLKDLRWLLIVAWFFFAAAMWAVFKNVPSRKRRVLLIGASSFLCAMCLLWLNIALRPKGELRHADALPQTTAPEPVPNPTAVAPIPATKDQNYVPQVKLRFKASPIFTAKRQMKIQREIDSYFSYLGSIGFDKAQELPLIGIAHGKVSFSETGWQPSTIYSEEIMLPAVYIDDPQYVRAPFSTYVFEKLFNPDPPPSRTRKDGFLMSSAIVFSNYYLADFSNTPPPAPADKWVSAMWDIRGRYGREFANNSLFYAFKQWNVPVEDVNREDFDSYFGRRFGIGLGVEDNMQEHLEGVAQILKARGISY